MQAIVIIPVEKSIRKGKPKEYNQSLQSLKANKKKLKRLRNIARNMVLKTTSKIHLLSQLIQLLDPKRIMLKIVKKKWWWLKSTNFSAIWSTRFKSLIWSWVYLTLIKILCFILDYHTLCIHMKHINVELYSICIFLSI